MSEVTQDVYTNGLKAHQKRMKHIFNNAQYSDTEFTVQQQKFYVPSQIVSVASSKLDAIISEHFAHCDDKKIKLHAVKCEKSFAVILQYMYGLDINFSELTMHVLCGVINLAVTYQLDEFAKDLKSYLSKLDKYEMDSLAVLLNTARKYNLDDLYGKLKVFAFEHAEGFVKHDSIVTLLYEVLLDLIKSDGFCAEEIDILKGVLKWHIEMNSKDDKKSVDEDARDVESQDDGSSVKSDCESDHTTTSTDMLSTLDDKTEEEYEDIEHVELKLEDKDNSNEDNINSEPETCNQKDKCAELVKSFSENVFKSLLLHVRIKQISMFDFMAIWKTNLAESYKDILEDRNNFSQTDDPRQQKKVEHVRTDEPLEKKNFLIKSEDIKKVFKLQYASNWNWNIRYKFKDSFIVNNFIWTFYHEYVNCQTKPYQNYFLTVYLECTSDKQGDWECTTECQLSLITSDETKRPTQVLPLKSLTFTKDNSNLFLGEFYSDSPNWFNAFYNSGFYTLEILFKSIRVYFK